MSGTLKDTGCKPQSHGESAPGGGPCPRCGRPRCTAAAKTRPGERCRKNPHPGATICTNHGLTEAGRAAAQRRVAEAEAEKVLAGLVWNPNAEPVTDSVAELQRLAGAMKGAVDVLGGRLNANEVCESCGRSPESLDGPTAIAWARAIREQRQMLADMKRLGFEERMVELEQAKAERVIAAQQRQLDLLHRELPGGLPPALRSLLIQEFLVGLGIDPGRLEGLT